MLFRLALFATAACLSLSSGGALLAQVLGTGAPKVTLDGFEQNGKIVDINFSINYDGVVEIRVVDMERQGMGLPSMVITRSFVYHRGSHKFSYNHNSIKSGKMYYVKLFFKGSIAEDVLAGNDPEPPAPEQPPIENNGSGSDPNAGSN